MLEETDGGDDIMKAYGREMFDETEGNAKSTTKTGVGHNKYKSMVPRTVDPYRCQDQRGAKNHRRT